MTADKIIGGFILGKEREDRYHLFRIFMHPDYQNSGIGKLAIDYMESSYPEVKKWTLDTPDWAVRNHHFYKKIGYTKVKEKYFASEGFNLIFYEKVIG